MGSWVGDGVTSSGLVIEGGNLHVANGGIIKNTTINKGFGWVYGKAYDTVINGGELNLCNYASNTIIANDGYVEIEDDAVVDNVIVKDGGELEIQQGAICRGLALSNGADVWIEQNATVTNIDWTPGEATISYIRGAHVSFNQNYSGVYLGRGGKLTTHTASMNNVNLDGEGDLLCVFSGGSVNNVNVTSEKMFVYSGGKATNITVGEECKLVIQDGGVVDGVVGKHGADWVEIYWGAKVTNVNLEKDTNLRLGIGKDSYVQGTSAGNKFEVNDGKMTGFTLTGDSWLQVYEGGVVSNVIINGHEETELCVEDGGIAINTVVKDGHIEIEEGSTIQDTYIEKGDITISCGCTVKGDFQLGTKGSYEFEDIEDGFNRVYNIENRKAGATFFKEDLLPDEDFSRFADLYISVSANQGSGKYALVEDCKDVFSGKTFTITCEEKNLGKIVAGTTTTSLKYNNVVYDVFFENDDLFISVNAPPPAPVKPEIPQANLLKNGVSQIVAWDKEKGAVGFVATDGTPGNKWRGIWDWDGKDVELWRVVGVGHFKGSTVDHDGILLYNGIGTTFAAWTNLNDPSYGYVNLCHVEGNFNTKTLSNLDNNQYDDVLIYDEKGSFGVVLDGATYKDIWHVDDAKTNQWTLRGAGNFGGKEEKLVVENKSGHLYLWQNNDTTFKTWNWSQTAIGYLGDDFEFVATGDFMGDGIDDILVRNTKDGGIWMWDNGDSKTAHWEVTPGKGFKAEAVGDYNGDGKDDLLVREYNTGWGGLGYYAFGGDQLWNDLNARIETDLESKFAVIA